MFRFLLLFYCFTNLSMATDSVVDSSLVKKPDLAWKLSLIPGMGQVYNERYLKSGFFIITSSYAYFKRSTFISSGEIGKRNTYSWWLFGLYVWGILDAYVDAQLSTFPKNESNEFTKEENK